MKKVNITGNGKHTLSFETVLKLTGETIKGSVDLHIIPKHKNGLGFFGIGQSVFEIPETYGHPRYYWIIDDGEMYGAFHRDLVKKDPKLYKPNDGSPYYSIRLEWLTVGIMENINKMHTEVK
jgi:hypothetical protein